MPSPPRPRPFQQGIRPPDQRPPSPNQNRRDVVSPTGSAPVPVPKIMEQQSPAKAGGIGLPNPSTTAQTSGPVPVSLQQNVLPSADTLFGSADVLFGGSSSMGMFQPAPEPIRPPPLQQPKQAQTILPPRDAEHQQQADVPDASALFMSSPRDVKHQQQKDASDTGALFMAPPPRDTKHQQQTDVPDTNALFMASPRDAKQQQQTDVPDTSALFMASPRDVKQQQQTTVPDTSALFMASPRDVKQHQQTDVPDTSALFALSPQVSARTDVPDTSALFALSPQVSARTDVLDTSALFALSPQVSARTDVPDTSALFALSPQVSARTAPVSTSSQKQINQELVFTRPQSSHTAIVRQTELETTTTIHSVFTSQGTTPHEDIPFSNTSNHHDSHSSQGVVIQQEQHIIQSSSTIPDPGPDSSLLFPGSSEIDTAHLFGGISSGAPNSFFAGLSLQNPTQVAKVEHTTTTKVKSEDLSSSRDHKETVHVFASSAPVSSDQIEDLFGDHGGTQEVAAFLSKEEDTVMPWTLPQPYREPPNLLHSFSPTSALDMKSENTLNILHISGEVETSTSRTQSIEQSSEHTLFQQSSQQQLQQSQDDHAQAHDFHKEHQVHSSKDISLHQPFASSEGFGGTILFQRSNPPMSSTSLISLDQESSNQIQEPRVVKMETVAEYTSTTPLAAGPTFSSQLRDIVFSPSHEYTPHQTSLQEQPALHTEIEESHIHQTIEAPGKTGDESVDQLLLLNLSRPPVTPNDLPIPFDESLSGPCSPVFNREFLAAFSPPGAPGSSLTGQPGSYSIMELGSELPQAPYFSHSRQSPLIQEQHDQQPNPDYLSNSSQWIRQQFETEGSGFDQVSLNEDSTATQPTVPETSSPPPKERGLASFLDPSTLSAVEDLLNMPKSAAFERGMSRFFKGVKSSASSIFASPLGHTHPEAHEHPVSPKVEPSANEDTASVPRQPITEDEPFIPPPVPSLIQEDVVVDSHEIASAPRPSTPPPAEDKQPPSHEVLYEYQGQLEATSSTQQAHDWTHNQSTMHVDVFEQTTQETVVFATGSSEHEITRSSEHGTTTVPAEDKGDVFSFGSTIAGNYGSADFFFQGTSSATTSDYGQGGQDWLRDSVPSTSHTEPTLDPSPKADHAPIHTPPQGPPEQAISHGEGVGSPPNRFLAENTKSDHLSPSNIVPRRPSSPSVLDREAILRKQATVSALLADQAGKGVVRANPETKTKLLEKARGLLEKRQAKSASQSPILGTYAGFARQASPATDFGGGSPRHSMESNCSALNLSGDRIPVQPTIPVHAPALPEKSEPQASVPSIPTMPEQPPAADQRQQDSMHALLDENQQLKHQIDGLLATVKDLEKNQTQAASLELHNKLENQQLKHQIDIHLATIKDLEKNQTQVASLELHSNLENRQLKQQIDGLLATIKDLEKNQTQVASLELHSNQENQQLRHQIDGLLATIKDLEKNQTQVASLEFQNHELHSELDDVRAELQMAQSTIEGSSAKYSQQMNDLRKEILQLQADSAHAWNLVHSQNANSDLESKCQRLEEELEQALHSIRSHQASDVELGRLSAENEHLRQELHHTQHQVKELSLEQQAQRATSPINSNNGSGSFEQLSREAEGLRRQLKGQRAEMKDMEDAIKRSDAEKRSLALKVENLERSLENAAKHRNELISHQAMKNEEYRAIQEKLVSSFEEEKAQYIDEEAFKLAKLEVRYNQVQEQVQQLQSQIAEATQSTQQSPSAEEKDALVSSLKDRIVELETALVSTQDLEANYRLRVSEMESHVEGAKKNEENLKATLGQVQEQMASLQQELEDSKTALTKLPLAGETLIMDDQKTELDSLAQELDQALQREDALKKELELASRAIQDAALSSRKETSSDEDASLQQIEYDRALERASKWQEDCFAAQEAKMLIEDQLQRVNMELMAARAEISQLEAGIGSESNFQGGGVVHKELQQELEETKVQLEQLKRDELPLVQELEYLRSERLRLESELGVVASKIVDTDGLRDKEVQLEQLQALRSEERKASDEHAEELERQLEKTKQLLLERQREVEQLAIDLDNITFKSTGTERELSLLRAQQSEALVHRNQSAESSTLLQSQLDDVASKYQLLVVEASRKEAALGAAVSAMEDQKDQLQRQVEAQSSLVEESRREAVELRGEINALVGKVQSLEGELASTTDQSRSKDQASVSIANELANVEGQMNTLRNENKQAQEQMKLVVGLFEKLLRLSDDVTEADALDDTLVAVLAGMEPLGVPTQPLRRVGTRFIELHQLVADANNKIHQLESELHGTKRSSQDQKLSSPTVNASQAPQAPESPQTPKTPQTPQTPRTPQIPQVETNHRDSEVEELQEKLSKAEQGIGKLQQFLQEFQNEKKKAIIELEQRLEDSEKEVTQTRSQLAKAQAMLLSRPSNPGTPTVGSFHLEPLSPMLPQSISTMRPS
ncbi:hypothetical protein B0O80DRAFT_217006 [Mortierella sp. GBAus27b]|nr:hypothetical protein B0O80DRAFT_217006 [Mortierella sp. GBAus27b]